MSRMGYTFENGRIAEVRRDLAGAVFFEVHGPGCGVEPDSDWAEVVLVSYKPLAFEPAVRCSRLLKV